MDPREKLDVTPENLGQSHRRRFPTRPHRITQEVERRLKVQLFRLTLDGEHQPRHRLVEKLVPGAGPDHTFVVQELLQLVGKLVRAHRAQAVEHRLVARKVSVGGHQAGQVIIVQPVELKAEEHQRSGRVRDLVLRVAHELGALGVDGILIVAQTGVGHEPSGDHLDPLVFQHAGQ